MTCVIIALIFAPCAIALIFAISLFPKIGLAAFLIPLLSLPFCYAINQWQFPYTNGFEIWHPRCRN